MKKSFACFVLLLAMVKCFSQNTTDQLANEQTIGNAIFLFAPVQREGVTEQRFHYAQQIINDTKSASKNNVQNLNAADFWNITTAFVILKEPKSHIEAAFNKAIHSDAATIC
jgi:K+-transporting ATPase A subunit